VHEARAQHKIDFGNVITYGLLLNIKIDATLEIKALYFSKSQS
jgi:hypothetical protein